MVTISPSFSLYRMVVFPAASRPTIRIRISFLPNRPLNRVANTFPMVTKLWKYRGGEGEGGGKQVRKVPKSQGDWGTGGENVYLTFCDTISFPRRSTEVKHST